VNNTTGSNNVFIGNTAGNFNTTGSNNVFIGNTGSNVSNSLWLPTGIDSTTGTDNRYMIYNPSTGRVSLNQQVYGIFRGNTTGRFYTVANRTRLDYENNILSFSVVNSNNITFTDSNNSFNVTKGIYFINFRGMWANSTGGNIPVWMSVLLDGSPLINSVRRYIVNPGYNDMEYNHILDLSTRDNVSFRMIACTLETDFETYFENLSFNIGLNTTPITTTESKPYYTMRIMKIL
jgi:hypothetical protein